jgi:peptidyl-prolyl cis-trans isomerase-like 4
VTRDEDLELIFSRFGTIMSCQVIRDKLTGDSLQYAFIEFDKREEAEQAYFKMQNVLIDDRRIWVDFSQSVSRLNNVWSNNPVRAQKRGHDSFGGRDDLEKSRKYRDDGHHDRGRGDGYGMVFDIPKRDSKKDRRRSRSRDEERETKRRRSRSPRHDTERLDRRRSRERDHSRRERDDRRY